MASLKEITDRQDVIRAELDRIEKNPAATEETDGDMIDTLVSEFETLEQRRQPLAERAKQLNLIRFKSGDDGNLEGATAGMAGSTGPDLVVRTKHDPFEGLDELRRSDSNLQTLPRQNARDRGMWAVERSVKMGSLADDFAHTAMDRIDGDWTGGIAKHCLLTGSDEYLEAYRAYLQNPEQNLTRTALSLTSANGGYLLPYVLDPTIILTNTGSANPYRRISRVVTTTSNAWQGVNSAGVNAGWLAEGTATTDASPTVGQIQITPVKGAAWVYGSFEVLADTDFGQQLPGLLADAKDRLEETAFAVGTGTAQPLGVVAAITGSSILTAATTGAYVLADVYTVHGGLPPRFRTSPNAAWVMNVAVINKTRQFDTAGGSSFWTNLGLGQPEQLLGKRIEESTSVVGTLTTGSKIVVFGDFSQFIIVDRVGVSLLYEPLVKSTATASPNFPTGQAGWFMFWRVSSATSNNNAFRVLTT